MDGVLCNFDKAYRKITDKKEKDHKYFRSAVMQYKIFEDLEMLSDTQELLDYVKTLDVTVEILTSMGTHDSVQGAEAKRQKLLWLSAHNITYTANFVRSKEEKSKFAHDRAILVDDSPGCINPFSIKNGHGILHTNATESIQLIHETIRGIRGLYALRKDYA
jgi:hypothetical protein